MSVKAKYLTEVIGKRPQLHISAIDALSSCGEAFRRRYIEEERHLVGTGAIVGSAVDDSATANLRHKMQHGELMPYPQVLAIAEETLQTRWNDGVLVTDEEAELGEDALFDALRDKVERLCRAHYEQLAPKLSPIHVQRAWTLRLDRFGIDLAGTIDVQEADCVRDLKCRAKSPSASEAADSEQLTMYALAVARIDGTPGDQLPMRVAIDAIVDLKRGAEVRTQESLRGKADFRVLLNRVEAAVDTIERGAFMPAKRDSWQCSPKYCVYFDTCRYVRNRAVHTIGGQTSANDETKSG